MCEHSTKLMAWLDRELDSAEMAMVDLHVQGCPDCRERAAGYTRISSAFDEYCKMQVAACPDSGRTLNRSVGKDRPAETARSTSVWVPAISAIAATAVIALLVWISPRPRVQHSVPEVAPAIATVRPEQTPKKIARPITAKRPAHTRHGASRQPASQQTASWLPPEPAIQVAIPAESIFPPGAVPDGVNFIADVSLGADGSPQQIRLQPQLIGFERRTMQP
jgi:anti-sigma factor RsiW